MSLSLHECSGNYNLGMTPMGEKESQLKTLLPTFATIEALRAGLSQSLPEDQAPQMIHEGLGSLSTLYDQHHAMLIGKMEGGTMTAEDIETFSQFMTHMTKAYDQSIVPLSQLAPSEAKEIHREFSRRFGTKLANDLPLLVMQISQRMPIDLGLSPWGSQSWKGGSALHVICARSRDLTAAMDIRSDALKQLSRFHATWKEAALNVEYLTPSIIPTPTVPAVQPEIIFPVIEPKPAVPALTQLEQKAISDAKKEYDETDALSLIAALLLGMPGQTGNFNADFKKYIHPILNPMTISDYEGSDFRKIGVDSDLEIALNNLELHPRAKYAAELIKVFQEKERFIKSLPAEIQKALQPGTDRIKPIVERMVAAIELGNYDFGKDATDLRTLERQLNAGILAHTDLQNLA